MAVSVFYFQVLFHEDGSVKGIATNDVGIAKDGSPKVMNNLESSFYFRVSLLYNNSSGGFDLPG